MLLVHIIASLMFRPYATVPHETDVVGLHYQTLVDHSIQTPLNRFIVKRIASLLRRPYVSVS